MSQRPRPLWISLAVLTGAYFCAGRLGLSLAFVNESTTAVWPPAGIALAALLIGGMRLWPAVLAGAFLVNVSTTGAVSASLAIACGNTLEAVVGTWLALRFARGTAAFERPDTILRFVLVSAVTPSLIAATVGAWTLTAAGQAAAGEFGSIWFTWWFGDTVGIAVVAPLVILWSSRRAPLAVIARPLESAAIGVALLLLSFLIFGQTPLGASNAPLAFVVVPFLLWLTFRLGAWETAVASAVLSAVAIWGTLHGFGPFIRSNPHESLLLLQAFVGVLSPVMIAVAAEVSNRRASEVALRLLNDDLEKHVRHRTEDLTRIHERLQEAQSVAHIGSWEWDTTTDSLWWSDELHRIYGVERDAAPTYAAFLALVHPDDRASVDATVRAAMASRRPFVVQHRVVWRDGTVRIIHGNGRVVTDEDGTSVRLMGVGHDVTDRVVAEQERARLLQERLARREAEDANRAKDEFMAMLSHELRTPINAALGWAQMLRGEGLDQAGRTRAIEAINRNLILQARLVSDLTDVVQASTNALRLDMGHVDLGAVIAGALEMVSAAAADKAVTIRTVAPKPPALRGDAVRLQQVLWNLLSNAVRFARNGGYVDLLVIPRGEVVDIVVEDDGPGIEASALPKIFDRFWQAEPLEGIERGGLGLGLHIARQLVEGHGGTITATNGPTGGARMTVCLPVAVGAVV